MPRIYDDIAAGTNRSKPARSEDTNETATQGGGGGGGLNDVVDDLSPQLGGDLDTQSFHLTTTDTSPEWSTSGASAVLRFKATDANGQIHHWATKGHKFFASNGSGETTVTAHGNLNVTGTSGLDVTGYITVGGDAVFSGNLYFPMEDNTASNSPAVYTERDNNPSGAVGSSFSLGQFQHKGNDGSSFSSGFEIETLTTQAWSGANKGAEAIFKVPIYNSSTLQEAFRITSGTTSIMGIQVASSAKLYFGTTDQQIFSQTSDLFYEVSASNSHKFTVALNTICTIDSDGISFGAKHILGGDGDQWELDWSSDDEFYILGAGSTQVLFNDGSVDFQLGTGSTEMYLSSNSLSFNNGATDTSVAWNTSGQLDFKVGSNIEMSLTADALTFEAGFADYSLNWGTTGSLKLRYFGSDKMTWNSSNVVTPAGYDIDCGGRVSATDGFEHAITEISSNTTINEHYEVVLVDTSGGSVTVTLPAAASYTGIEFRFVKTSASNVMTVDGNGAETISGAATMAKSKIYDSITIVSDGTEWYVIT